MYKAYLKSWYISIIEEAIKNYREEKEDEFVKDSEELEAIADIEYLLFKTCVIRMYSQNGEYVYYQGKGTNGNIITTRIISEAAAFDCRTIDPELLKELRNNSQYIEKEYLCRNKEK